MIWVTEIDKSNIIFQFFDRELPEDITPAKKTKVNHIEYPGGHQTNQIIGVYQEPIEWSGVLFGTYNIGGKTITAKHRVEQIKALMGRPLRFGFPFPGGNPIPGLTAEMGKDSDKDYKNGDTGEYIIETFTPRIKNPLHVEYSIKLIPHQRQEKIRPDETVSLGIKVDYMHAATNAAKAQAIAQSKKTGTNKTVAKGNAVAQLVFDIPPKAPILEQKKIVEIQQQYVRTGTISTQQKQTVKAIQHIYGKKTPGTGQAYGGVEDRR